MRSRDARRLATFGLVVIGAPILSYLLIAFLAILGSIATPST